MNIVEQYSRLVWKLANRYARRSRSNVGDLASAGFVGLLEAAQLYDSAQATFQTYAWYWIKKRILEEVNKDMKQGIQGIRGAPNRVYCEVASEDGSSSIDEYLAKLADPLQAIVIALRYIDNLTVRETASVLGVSCSRVVRTERSAIVHLRRELTSASLASIS